ncbi:MAG: helix-turn-helix transcriptional regulator [Thermofilaceae archaeon]
MSVDEVFEGLVHEIRRKIIKSLGESKVLTYKELLEIAGVETGVLNYHLGKLKGLVEKTEDGKYTLTRNGLVAYKVLRYFETGVDDVQPTGINTFSVLKDVFICPQRVFAEPDVYGVYAAIPAIILFLVEYIVTSNFYAAATVTLAPAIITSAIALVVYGAAPSNLRNFIKGYPATLSPLCLVPVMEFILKQVSAPPQSVSLTSGALVAVYIAYNTLFIQKNWKLDYAKSFIVSITNTFILAYFLRLTGLAYYLIPI